MRALSGMLTKQRGFFIQNLVPREGQKEAFSATMAFISQFSVNCKTSGLLLSGGAGSGKTMLAAAISNAVIDAAVIKEADAVEAGECGM